MRKTIPQSRKHFAIAALAASVALVLALGATPVSRAEVAVDLAPNNEHPDLVIVSVVGIIIDDGDPMIWDSFRPDSPTHFVLNPNGAANNDGPPHLFRKSAHAVIAVWAKNQGSRYEIVMSEFAGGAWSAEQVLVAGAGPGGIDNALDPQLIRNPNNGGYDLLYWSDGANPSVWRMQAPADLSSWSAAEEISLPGEAALRPSAAYYTGKLHVAYEVHADAQGAGPHEVALAVEDLGAGSGVYTYSTLTVTPYLGIHRPTLHTAADRLWVEWVDDASLVCWDRQQQPGVWDGIGEQSFGSLEERVIDTPGHIRALALQD